MSKRLVFLFCALFAFAMAVPAFAAVQNVKVSGEILARTILRNNFDLTDGNTINGFGVELGATGLTDDVGNNVFNSVVALRVDADLTDNIQTVVKLINERAWDDVDATNGNESNTDIDLDLAYVTMKEFLYSPLTISIGRQELHFGNDFIIGDVNTNGTTNYVEAPGYGTRNGDLAYRKAFDAIKATLNYDPLVLDVVYAKIDTNTQVGNHDDIDLYGVNAGYKLNDKWNTLTEGYIWYKNDNATEKADRVYTVGVRATTNPTSKLNLQHEFGWQGGSRRVATGVSRDRSAWASQSMAFYTPGWKFDPTLGLIYSYYSGDKDPSGTDTGKAYHAWDSMFENQTAGHIINTLFGASNCHDIDFQLKAKPFADVSLQLDYVYLTLAKPMLYGYFFTNDYNGNGTFLAGDKERHLGDEFDMNITYDYTEDVQFGLLSGWFFPGDGLMKDTNMTAPSTVDQTREVASEVIASCKVNF